MIYLGHYQGSMNFSHLVMSGHSFRGATSLLTLAVDTRFKYTAHFKEINS